MPDFTMPSLGADMVEGTLLEWLVAPGDTVHRGDVVAVVDTAKAAVEVESFVEGVVQELVVEPGTVVPVGEVLAVLGDGAAARPAAPEAAPPVVPATPEAAPPAVPIDMPVAPRVSSPLVRREAEQLGIDLTSIAGSGRGGTITRADVTAAARAATPGRPPVLTPAPPPAPAPAQCVRPRPGRHVTPYARRLAEELGVDLDVLVVPDGEPVRARDVRAAAAVATPPPSGQEPGTGHVSRPEAMRTAIARVMSRSKREIPHYYLSTTVDLAPTLDWLHQRNRVLDVTRRLVPAALMLKATALAARQAPAMNGFWVDGAFQPAGHVHLGVAISLRGGGLVAPALHDAADLPLEELMVRMRDLVTRARGGRLRRSELSDPTLTVTNLGEQGVESVHGVIYPPQVALVGFGRVVDRAWAVDGLLGVRPVTTLTLAGDHRATDGFTGARFLADIEQRLSQPEDL